MVHTTVEASHREDVANARKGFTRLNLASWLGHASSASEAVMFHRAYAHLDELGLIERVNFYGVNRTTHLRLTEEGEQIAQQLLGPFDNA